MFVQHIVRDYPCSVRATGSGPADGEEWKPATSGNSIIWDGSSVVKNHGGRLEAYACEFHAMKVLSNHLPVPAPLPTSRPGSLRLPFIDGIGGRDLCDRDQPGALMFQLGAFLRRLRELDPGIMEGALNGAGGVIVHGDFAFYNAIMSQDRESLLAVLDWERAYLGDAITDLAWCEWQLRTAYPHHAWAAHKLFEGYGEAPPVDDRERAVAARLAQLRAEAAHRRGD